MVSSAKSRPSSATATLETCVAVSMASMDKVFQLLYKLLILLADTGKINLPFIGVFA
jgi:hypothetical protein